MQHLRWKLLVRKQHFLATLLKLFVDVKNFIFLWINIFRKLKTNLWVFLVFFFLRGPNEEFKPNWLNVC